MPISECVILPWLQIPRPLTVCDIAFLPLSYAARSAGTSASALQDVASYLYSHHLVVDTAAYARTGTIKADRLDPLKPTIVFVSRDATVDKITTAIQALSFASIAASAGQSANYVNSTVFSSYVQKLGGGGFIGRRTRRLHGTALAGSPTALLIDVKPAWCGQFAMPDLELLDALCKVIFRPMGSRIRRTLRALFGATSDADLIFSDLERSLYALASENLLYRRGLSNRFAAQRQRGEQLLLPFLSHRRRTTVPRRPSRIMSAWKVIREDRNSFWHPEARRRGRFAFERQTKVHPNLIAFQVLRALIVASLREMRAIPKGSKLLAVIPAVEAWLKDLGPRDSRDSDRASNLGPYISQQAMRESTRQMIENLTRHGGFARLAKRK